VSARAKSRRRIRPWGLFRIVLLAIAPVFLAAVLIWFLALYSHILYYEHHNLAAPADAIVVFGAAEYDGRPSPVLRARLDHALELYRAGYAPLVITLGGQGGDEHSEGGVGHNYLLGSGVPESKIIAETESNSTEESVDQLAIIARTNHLRRILAVSDGTHLYRIRRLLMAHGLVVYTSPRATNGSISSSLRTERVLHEMLSYTLWRLTVH
jgi:uncharacterized SAM-binding protein YcdF (DUF218 family)